MTPIIRIDGYRAAQAVQNRRLRQEWLEQVLREEANDLKAAVAWGLLVVAILVWLAVG